MHCLMRWICNSNSIIKTTSEQRLKKARGWRSILHYHFQVKIGETRPFELKIMEGKISRLKVKIEEVEANTRGNFKGTIKEKLEELVEERQPGSQRILRGPNKEMRKVQRYGTHSLVCHFYHRAAFL